MSTTEAARYTRLYTEEGFWQKVARFALAAGREVIEKALVLYYAARDPDTPTRARAVAYSALGYLILPADVIPDVLPAVGFSDDLSAILIAISVLAPHIKPEHRQAAKAKAREWFD